MASSFLFVIIAPLSWARSKIKFRRHRLAEYLKQQKDTAELIWIYPVSASLRITGSFGKAKKEVSHTFDNLDKKNVFKELALPDLMPGRYMQFKATFGNLTFLKLKKYLDNYVANKILLYTYPAYPYLVNMINWDLVIYDYSDLWTEPSGGSRSDTFSAITANSLIFSAEKKIVDKSKIIFASSDFLAARIEKISCRKAVTIENGVDLFYFSDQNRNNYNVLQKIPHPRLGYVGALRSKIDFALLDELAVQNPGWSIVLTGPDCLNNKAVFQKLLQKENVFWTGEVQQQEIPDYIKSLDVGLLPYREIEYNKAVFPIKFYEYLSQGIPVVGCGIPSTKKYAAKGIYLHVEREKYMEACQKALAWAGAAEEDFTAKRVKLAREAGWDNKLAQMLEKLKEQSYN